MRTEINMCDSGFYVVFPPSVARRQGDILFLLGLRGVCRTEAPTGSSEVIRVYRNWKEWFVAVVATFVSNGTTPIPRILCSKKS